MEKSVTKRAEFNTDPVAPEGRLAVVLQILPRLDFGGVERGTVEVAAALAGAGWTALVASAGGRLEREIKRVGGRHFTLPLQTKNPLKIRANVGRLVELIEAQDVDIVHARSRAPAWSGYFAARRTGRHFVTTYHGRYFGGGAVKRWYNSVMLRGERVIVASRFIRDHVLERYGAEESRLRLIARGVDVERFDPAKANRDTIVSLARRWGIPDGASVVMLVGRLASWKGQEVLVEAMSRLKRPNVFCVLVGEDRRSEGTRRRLERLIKARGLGGRVRIVGLCDDMPAGYMLADVVVSASTMPEAFGRSVIEAQAMGRPVIATDHGGARETVLADETGWLVRPGDPDALSKAMGHALGLDPERRAVLAQAAIAHVRANYTVELMCERTLAVYRELLAADRPPLAAANE